MSELHLQNLGIQPADEHNLRLVEQVHPVDWVNPEPAPRYHLVVVGAGTAGLVAAAGAAALGARVALVERHLMGGDCLNYGCVPSKGLLRAARSWHAADKSQERFAGPAHVGSGDFAEAMRRMRRLRADLARIDGAPRFKELGVDVFLGEGRFVAPDAVEVGGRRLVFRRAVIATGARPAAPAIPGLADVGYVTNETIFNLVELPRRFAVIGGGPIGCELAQAFARFGAYTALFNDGAHVLRREDPDAAAIVEKSLERDGVRLELGTRVLEVARRSRDGKEKLVRFERDGKVDEFVANEVLVSAGRAPNVEGLGLEAAGVAYGAQGVQVDGRLRTTNPRIFAAGDVCTALKFTHHSDAQARIVLRNALFAGRAKAADLVLPWCTYTSPELAHVGVSGPDAGNGAAVDTVTVALADVDRAVLDGEDEGFLRLHLKRGSDRILGATVVGEHAGEMAGALSLVIRNRIGLQAIAETIFPYPTQGEALKKAADTWRRQKLTPFNRRLLGLWLWLKR